MMETPTVATYEAFKKEYGQSYALKAGSVLLVYKCVMDPGAFFKGMCVREGFVIWGGNSAWILVLRYSLISGWRKKAIHQTLLSFDT